MVASLLSTGKAMVDINEIQRRFSSMSILNTHPTITIMLFTCLKKDSDSATTFLQYNLTIVIKGGVGLVRIGFTI